MENLQSELTEINESIRQQLLNLENVRTEVIKLRVNSKAEGKLRERLNEYLSTALADLLIISDILFEAESCIDENDLNFLLELSDENIPEGYN